MFKAILFWLVTLVSFSALSVDRTVYVVGGTDASISDAPWQAFVVAKKRFCGGVVIGDKWVLTAAHCVDTAERTAPYSLIDLNLLSVYTGTEKLNKANIHQYLSFVEAVYVHSDYNKITLENDIALLKLSNNIHENSKPILMADAKVQADVDATGNLGLDDLLLTGWGATDAGRSQFSSTLQKVSLSTISDSSCAATWGSFITNVTNYQNKYFCAQKTQAGACNGDSGGPLVWSDPSRAADPDGGATLVGMVSFGVDIECASPIYPDVYTQISTYRAWISGCQEGVCPTSPLETLSQSGGGSFGLYFGLFVGWILLRRRLLFCSINVTK